MMRKKTPYTLKKINKKIHAQNAIQEVEMRVLINRMNWLWDVKIITHLNKFGPLLLARGQVLLQLTNLTDDSLGLTHAISPCSRQFLAHTAIKTLN